MGGALAAVILVVLIVVGLIVAIVAWFVYAYKNPNSKAGRWLIEVGGEYRRKGSIKSEGGAGSLVVHQWSKG